MCRRDILSCAKWMSIACASKQVFCGMVSVLCSHLMSSLAKVSRPPPSLFCLSFLKVVLYPMNSGVSFPGFNHVSLKHNRCGLLVYARSFVSLSLPGAVRLRQFHWILLKFFSACALSFLWIFPYVVDFYFLLCLVLVVELAPYFPSTILGAVGFFFRFLGLVGLASDFSLTSLGGVGLYIFLFLGFLMSLYLKFPHFLSCLILLVQWMRVHNHCHPLRWYILLGDLGCRMIF